MNQRLPVLVDSESAHVFLLKFDGYPTGGQVFIGRSDDPEPGAGGHTEGNKPDGGLFVNLARFDRDGLVLRKHAVLRLENGNFYIRGDSPEAEVLVNETPISGERQLAPFDRIKIGQCLLFFLP